MALELIGGAGLGTIFAMLYDVVKEEMGQNVNFKPLGVLKSTLDSLQPLIIQQIGEHNVKLDLPNDEVENLKIQMKEGAKLVRKLSNLRMWQLTCNCITRHREQLVELDECLKRLVERLKMQEARDVKETLLLARQNAERLVEFEECNKRLLEKLKKQVQHQQQQHPSALKETLLLARQNAKMLAEVKGSIRRLLDTPEVQQELATDVMETIDTVQNIETALEQVGKSNAVQVSSTVEGAALAAAFGELFDAVVGVKDNSKMFRLLLGDLDSTIHSLKPLITNTVEYTSVDCPKEKLEEFRIQMEEGEKLVRKCSKVSLWSSYKKYKFSSQLVELDKSLQRLIGILKEVQGRNQPEKTGFDQ